ncbi:MAG: ATP-binding protein [Myxococcota bacterium]
MYLARHIESTLQAALQEFPVVGLVGARQTGKSTLLKQLLGATYAYVTFDDLGQRAAARRDPKLFLSAYPGPTVLDEAQYVPELLSAIKQVVDADPTPGRFVLTGSQQLQLVRDLRETLVGRILLLSLHSMTAWERAGLGAHRHWLNVLLDDGPAALVPSRAHIPWEPLRELIRGGLPGLLDKSDRFLPGYFQSYVTTYLERDLPAQHQAQDPVAMGTFLRLLAPLTAQEINRSQLGRDIGVASPTSARWLSWLAGANLWHELPAYHANAVKRVSKSPKGMLFDTGLICSLLQAQRPGMLQAHPQLGAIFEAAVSLELQAVVDAALQGSTLYHWRTPYGHEVDIVIEHEGRLYAIECKWRSHVDPRELTGITAFRRTYGDRVAAAVVVTPVGDVRWITEGVLQVPWAPMPGG